MRFLQWVSEAMASLSDVVRIIDMDGFTIEKEFYCKELGIFKVGDLAAISYFLIWEYVAVGKTCLTEI